MILELDQADKLMAQIIVPLSVGTDKTAPLITTV